MFLIGFMYGLGHGVLRDPKEEVRWWQLAGEAGDPSAQSSLSLAYFSGSEDMPRNYSEAARWARPAAEQGESTAQKIMGVLYTMGQGVPQDYVQAHKWLNLAAASGDADCPRLRDELARKMTASQIEEAQRLASQWKPTESAKPAKPVR